MVRRRRPKPNPKVAGLPCAICGAPASSYSHVVHKGMGGDPQEDRTDGFPSCGVDHSDPKTCHGAMGQHLMAVWRDTDGLLRFRPDAYYARVLRRRGVPCHEGGTHVARYEDKDMDAIDCPREEMTP